MSPMGSGGFSVPGWLQVFDVENLGTTGFAASKLSYVSNIIFRTLGGLRRGWKEHDFNEPREHLVRDIFSLLVFYYTVPVFDRLFLGAGKYKQEMFQPTRKKGFLPWLKSWVNGVLPSTDDLRAAQLQLTELAKTQDKRQLVPDIEKHYAKLISRRTLSTWLGFGIVLALVGIGINQLNIVMTRNNVARKRSRAALMAKLKQNIMRPADFLARPFMNPNARTSVFSGTVTNSLGSDSFGGNQTRPSTPTGYASGYSGGYSAVNPASYPVRPNPYPANSYPLWR